MRVKPMETRKQNLIELKRIAAIENKFKDLGKFLYMCWLDDRPHSFELIMQEFNVDLTKLKETNK